MRVTRAPILLGLLVACGLPEDEDCHTLAVGSVLVEVYDTEGEPVVAADVRYSVDGGEEAFCSNQRNHEWVCGWGEEGAFVVWATATGFGTGSGEVDVASDGCHVVSEELVLELPPDGS